MQPSSDVCIGDVVINTPFVTQISWIHPETTGLVPAPRFDHSCSLVGVF